MASGQNTICWDCKRAAGPQMCRWARDGKPFPGWRAKPTMVVVDPEKQVNSFLVEACPGFRIGRLEEEDALLAPLFTDHGALDWPEEEVDDRLREWCDRHGMEKGERLRAKRQYNHLRRLYELERFNGE